MISTRELSLLRLQMTFRTTSSMIWWWWLFSCMRRFLSSSSFFFFFLRGKVRRINSRLRFFFLIVEIRSRTLISLLRPGPVHSGSASWDDFDLKMQQTIIDHFSSFYIRIWRSWELIPSASCRNFTMQWLSVCTFRFDPRTHVNHWWRFLFSLPHLVWTAFLWIAVMLCSLSSTQDTLVFINFPICLPVAPQSSSGNFPVLRELFPMTAVTTLQCSQFLPPFRTIIIIIIIMIIIMTVLHSFLSRDLCEHYVVKQCALPLSTGK